MITHTNLWPRLVVDDQDAALDVYRRALDAELIERFVDEHGRVVHAAFAVEGAVVSVAQAVPEWGLLHPATLGGSPCLLHLTVADADRSAQRMVAAGGRVVVPIADRPWGKREGRVVDPSGHPWILGTRLEDLDAAEVRRRLAAS